MLAVAAAEQPTWQRHRTYADAILETGDYLLVDDIPEACMARLEERFAAEALLEQRRQAKSGATEPGVDVPQAVDALSTADKAVWARQVFGDSSPEYREARSGLVLDSRRLVGEWYRKKTSEWFEPVRHRWDAELQDYFSHGFSLGTMTRNGIVWMEDDPEDRERRVNDHVENQTPKILMSLGCVAVGGENGEGVSMRTISQCTEQAKRAYEADMKAKRPYAGYKGYVPDVDKLYIRDYTFDAQTWDRYEEVVGVPGTYFDDYTLRLALAERKLDTFHMDRTELQGAQFLARDSLMEFMAHLDRVASEQWCVNIFMGEVVPDDFVKDYGRFMREAMQRQEQLAGLGETVAAFVEQLAEEGYDREAAPQKVEAFVKAQLLELGKRDYKAAEQMFDAETAGDLQEVRRLEERGEYGRAQELMEAVRERAPGGGFCGAGSCGLEGVKEGSEEWAEIAKEFGAKAGDTVLKDKERSCPNCHNATVVYVVNTDGFTKGCTTCKSQKKVASKA